MTRTFLFSLGLLLAAAAPLTAAEDGWADLFDGKTLTGWTTGDGKPVTSGWAAEDGVLHRGAKGGDIYTAKEYGDFELQWDWKIAPGGNSGVKYRVAQFGKSWLGFEYQMIDDAKNPDAGKAGGKHATASLYDLIGPAADKKLNPVGEWNTSRVVAKGTKIEHWLNGEKVVEIDLAGDTFEKALAASKFAKTKGFGKNPAGRIMLQDHGSEVWFRSIKIRDAGK